MFLITLFMSILILLVVVSIISCDHFKPINSLKIKFNSKNVIEPNKLKQENPVKLSLKEIINSELSSHPLKWEDQMYSMPVYPYVGYKEECKNDSDCSMYSSKCLKDSNYSTNYCTLRIPDKTIFDISY